MPLAGKPARRGGAERVEKLLAGELLDTSRFSYDFEVEHVAVVAVGPGASDAVEERTGSAALPRLVVDAAGGTVWGWLGKRGDFDAEELGALTSPDRLADARLAVGEPANGLAGWRLTHHQARAALPVALRGNDAVVRYGDVALLASIVKDDLLVSSLRQLYLEPLEGERDGGEALRRTLRAYFAADRNVSVAGAAIGVTRQAVARRLRAVEEKLERSIASCGADLEIALRFEALEATPPSWP